MPETGFGVVLMGFVISTVQRSSLYTSLSRSRPGTMQNTTKNPASVTENIQSWPCSIRSFVQRY